jgi:hypothetical protein
MPGQGGIDDDDDDEGRPIRGALQPMRQIVELDVVAGVPGPTSTVLKWSGRAGGTPGRRASGVKVGGKHERWV